jgi:hypothetical protein
MVIQLRLGTFAVFDQRYFLIIKARLIGLKR